MKIITIKHHKKVNKSDYLSHQKKESFLLQTIPSFIQAHQTYKQQRYCGMLGNWMNRIPSFINADSEKLVLTWLGHASFLIQHQNITIITDPVFGSLPFFPRITNHGISIDSIPPIDVVLLSHNHHDHMDLSSLTHLIYRYNRLTFGLPKGDRRWFNAQLFSSLYECEWHDELIFETRHGTTAHCIFLPAYHWSRRGPFDTNQSLWGSWLIKIGKYSIYFGGDSAYFKHFDEIGTNHTVDIALLPIAPIQPTITMTQSHMNPHDAGKAFFDLNANILIPMHWGTFQFGIDNWEDPIRLMREWEQRNSKKLEEENKKLCLLKIGEQFIL